MRILYDGLASIGHVRMQLVTPPSSYARLRGRPLGALRDRGTSRAVLHPNIARRRINRQRKENIARLRPASYDVVVLHRLGAAWWLGWSSPARSILDLDDVPSQIYAYRMRLGTPVKRWPRRIIYQWTRYCERRALDAFRFSLVCSTADQQYLSHPRTAVVPNSFFLPDTSSYHPVGLGQNTLLFVGSLGYPPNSDSVAWFVRAVLPRIRASVPNAQLAVVGRMPSRGSASLTWKDSPGVQLVGPVDDVTSYVRECAIEVCPLLRGQGTRIKILESLSLGRPVVSTSIGAYGLELDDSHGVYRRDDSESFASMCIRLLRDQAYGNAAARRGQDWVINNASPAVVAIRLKALVGTILTESGYADGAL